ncbi:MAG: DUF1122 family protein [Nitrososphaerales archaeon]
MIERSQHILYILEGKQLNEYKIHVEVKKRHYFEQRYFKLYLLKNEKIFNPPVFVGIYSSGRASLGIKGWIDGDYNENISSNGLNVNLAEYGLDIKLFKTLGNLIPRGGSMMVSYSMIYGESNVHIETMKALARGIPSILTPLGYLLFHAGCWAYFRDWYYPEGGNEGPKKLQGFKPINCDDAMMKAKEVIRMLKEFIKKGIIDDKQEEKAKDIIDTLSSYAHFNANP